MMRSTGSISRCRRLILEPPGVLDVTTYPTPDEPIVGACPRRVCRPPLGRTVGRDTLRPVAPCVHLGTPRPTTSAAPRIATSSSHGVRARQFGAGGNGHG